MKTGLRSGGARLAAVTLLCLASTRPAWGQDEPGPTGSAAAPATVPSAPPPSTPAAAPEASPGAAMTADSPASAAYAVKLHDLEHRVNELKEQIFRSKARLALLKETVLHGVIAGSRAIITHRNEMGTTYSLIKLVYALDGNEIYAKSDDTGHLGDTKEFEIFNGSIVPGNHTVTVIMVYQGNGYGVFSYLKGYKFNVKSSYTFTATEGKETDLKVVGYEKGNPITTDPKDRPAVDFRLNVASDSSAATAQKGSSAPATSTANSTGAAPAADSTSK